MALISPQGNYLRVEDIRVGKNLLQFFAREYSDTSKPPVYDMTYVIDYDLGGKNPYIQAYEYLLNNEYKNYRSDIPVVEVQDPILVVPSPIIEEAKPVKKPRTRKAK